jgi:hypothetical protein
MLQAWPALCLSIEPGNPQRITEFSRHRPSEEEGDTTALNQRSYKQRLRLSYRNIGIYYANSLALGMSIMVLHNNDYYFDCRLTA